MAAPAFSWTTIISGIFALVCAVGGGAYKIGADARQSELAALKEQVATAGIQVINANTRCAMTERYATDLEKRLDVCTKTRPNSNPKKAATNGSIVAGPPTVRISSPSSEKPVGKNIDVTIELAGSIPHGLHPALLVRDPLGQWWSWGSAQSDRWYEVKIGDATDSGKSFEIRVLLTDQKLTLGKLDAPPPPSVASDSIEVVRQ
jgi:hypothetical protein